MTWQIKLKNHDLNSNESCLELTHIQSKRTLRKWYGPMAQQLFHIGSKNLNIKQPNSDHQSIFLDKQATQSFLIQTSFHHHTCLHQFQVVQDINSKHIPITQELSEMLLYIRMTNQHPSHQDLEVFAGHHLSMSLDFSTALQTLIEAQLIQMIEVLHFKFYDKNPYPHDHIFYHTDQTLQDRTSADRLESKHSIINHHLNRDLITFADQPH